MAEYAGRLPLFHQDLYRLSGAEETLGGGLVDERGLDGVTLSEWAERLPRELDPDRLTIAFEVLGDDERRISVSAANDGTAALPAMPRPAGPRGRASDDPVARHRHAAARRWPRRRRRQRSLASAPGRAAIAMARSCWRDSTRCSPRRSPQAGHLTGVVVGTGPGSFTGSAHRPGDRQDHRLRAGHPDRRHLEHARARAGRRDRRSSARTKSPSRCPPVLPTATSIASRMAGGAAGRGRSRRSSWRRRPTVDERDGETISGLAAALARLGLARPVATANRTTQPTLVPAYVALPRGIAAAAAEMTWSPDLR